MTLRYTFHGQPPRDAQGFKVEALPAQIGNYVAVADGSASAELPEGLYRVSAITDSLFRHGLNVANGANGGDLKANDWVVVYVREGHKIGCSAYA
jgi:hypothetical protein